jgi:putative oxidoreductase
MKIATLIVRILIGALLLFASVSYFFQLFPEPPLAGNMKIFNDGLKASIYLMPMVKIVELLCGLSFIIGKFNRLTFIILMPISINILFTHIFLAPEGIAVATFLFLGNVFLLFTKWDSYKGLFVV